MELKGLIQFSQQFSMEGGCVYATVFITGWISVPLWSVLQNIYSFWHKYVSLWTLWLQMMSQKCRPGPTLKALSHMCIAPSVLGFYGGLSAYFSLLMDVGRIKISSNKMWFFQLFLPCRITLLWRCHHITTSKSPQLSLWEYTWWPTLGDLTTCSPSPTLQSQVCGVHWGRGGHFTCWTLLTPQPLVHATGMLSNMDLSKLLLLASFALLIIRSKGFAFLIYVPNTSNSSCLVTAVLI